MVATYQLTVIYELLDIRVLIHEHFFLLYRCCAFTYFFFLCIFSKNHFPSNRRILISRTYPTKKTPPPIFTRFGRYEEKMSKSELEIPASRLFYISLSTNTHSPIFRHISLRRTIPPRDIFKTRSWSTAGQRAIPLNFARDHVSATEICATLKEGNIPVETGEKERESE